MIGQTGNQTPLPAAAEGRLSAGKRADAPGQQAKAAVIVARDAGADLPRNAQGVAASAIARGADPASVFAALINSSEVAEDPASEITTGTPTPPGSVEADATIGDDATTDMALLAPDAAAPLDGKAPEVVSPETEKTFGPGAYLVSEDPLKALLSGDESDAQADV